MIVCVPVMDDGQVDPRLGRAGLVAVADVRGGEVRRWEEIVVGWDVLHDQATEGSHHARIARFIQEHGVRTVVAGHMGDGMRQMLDRMGVEVRLGATGPARDALLAATAGRT